MEQQSTRPSERTCRARPLEVTLFCFPLANKCSTFKTLPSFTQYVDINSSLGPASLPALAFQGATKTNKPQYPEGTLLFCRVTKADPNAGRVELSCIDLLDNKKSWNTGEATFKELKGGLVKDFPIAVSRQMLVESSPMGTLLERLGAIVQYELVVGYNGRVWVKAESASQVVLVFQAVERLVEMQCKVESVEFIMEQLAPKRK